MQGNGAAPKDSVRVTFVGHATAMIEMAGVKILTDPVFRDRLWFLRRRSPVTRLGIELKDIDAVVLSHMHFDHMDYPSLRMIPENVPIIAPEGASRYLQRKVVHDIAEMKIGESISVGDVEIIAAPSVHESGLYWPLWFPKSVLSFMFLGPQTIYFVGDTALFDSMREIGRLFEIDAALLPVWGYGPYIRGDHLTPTQAAHALAMLSPRVAIPIHWGTYHPVGPFWKNMSFLDHPPLAFALEATRQAPLTDVRVLSPGESTLIGGESRESAVETASGGVPVLEPVFA